VPAAIVAALAAAALVLLVPSRSGGTAVLAPASSTSLDDVILGSAQYPLVSSEAIAVPTTQPTQGVQEGAQSSSGPENAALTASEQEVPETVTVVVPVTVEQAVGSPPEPVAPALPVAAAQQAPNLPVADDTPALPLAAGG
jgi:hypothetical protein